MILEPLGGSWSAFGASWSALGISWRDFGCLLGRSWEHLGDFWRVFGGHVRAWDASLMRHAEILKKHDKHCKVLQQLRFGVSEIHAKITLEGKFGQL